MMCNTCITSESKGGLNNVIGSSCARDYGAVGTVSRQNGADKELFDGSTQRQILRYLRERIATNNPPRRFGKALTSDRVGLWRYRVGDYRLICRIEDDRLVVLVLAVGHRREVYE